MAGNTTISVCLIVKNEEEDLACCLTCLKDVADEIVIVDTGSTDKTKEVAAKFTDKIYDFKWVNDFSKARNFAFSKCSCDYIYSADADEYLDEENREKLFKLKKALLPEVEIVQFIYSEEGIQTVLNTKEELRPKLYKRLREFNWVDPVHETVRTLPVVFDSDIIIEHRAKGLHAPRDFSLIEEAFKREGKLSKKLYKMYAKEVYRWGDEDALKRAGEIFESIMEKEILSDDLFGIMAVVCTRAARVSGDTNGFIKHSSKILGNTFCTEICNELGEYFKGIGDEKEASLWFYNGENETEPLFSK